MAKKGAKYIFRMIRGKIRRIKITKKGVTDTAKGAGVVTLGTLTGAAVGSDFSAVFQLRKRKKFEETFHRDKVDTKKTVRGLGKEFKDVKVITSIDDLWKQKGLSTLDKIQLAGPADMAQKSQNAFALKYKGKRYLIAPRKVNKIIIGHELGHLRDTELEKNPLLKHGVIGALTGLEEKTEKKAWDLSPIKIRSQKQRDDKNLALSTYNEQKIGTRIGAGVGLSVSGKAVIDALKRVR